MARWFSISFSLIGLTLPLGAQSVISARSGLIHYTEGDVFVADKKVEVKATSFPELKEGEILKTGEGRAEILLNPGAFLRLGENSSVRMIIARLSDTRIEFLSGSAIIESDDLLKEKDNSLTVLYKDASVEIRKSGIYRFDSEPAQLRVYNGEADVKIGQEVFSVKEGRLLPLTGAVTAVKFDPKTGDALSRWSKRRAEVLAMAHLSGAKQVRDSGNSWTRAGWFYNPYFSMFCYVPFRGSWISPYGFSYYSPRLVYRVYERPLFYSRTPTPYGLSSGPSWNPSYGYHTVGPTTSGQSGTVAVSGAVAGSSAPSTSASGAASAPISRGNSVGGGRSR